VKLKDLLAKDPAYFDAQLALGMAFFRKGDYATAIQEGHKAEQLNPKDQLVHTNLSLFYMKAGDKQTAEHHGLQARIVGWKKEIKAPAAASEAANELKMAAPPKPSFPEMPWKKKKIN
jgi:Flp pilus assembly protein TadD